MSTAVACPDKERLRRSLDPDDPMPPSERQSIEGHLESCMLGCKDSIAELLRGDLSSPPRESLEILVSPSAMEAPQSEVLLPGYELLDVLGQGGQSIVYQARQRGLDRLVAVKIMLGGQHASTDDRVRFQREALAVARLKHPHIVEIHDVGEQDGQPYCILEYLPGGSLATKLARLPQPPGEAAALTEILARAVHWAHEQGIVHRDLKPANVLLTAEGHPKITDFGLARRMDDDAGLTQTGSVMGTPSYMAPEQARGLTKEIGPLADVYALGAILYEMLTGRPPFLGTTPWDVLAQVLEQEPVPPRHLQPKIDTDLETICLKCLTKEPQRRYQDAAELADDLQRFLAGEPIHARATPWWEHTWRWARRNPAVASLLGTLAAVIVSAFVGLSLLYWRAEQQRQLAQQNEAGAKSVTRFLEDNVLAAARPKGLDGGAGYNVTLKNALDQAAPKIEAAFVGQPEREAVVRNTIGMTYWYLTLFDAASPHLERAHQLRLEQLGANHPDTIASLHNLAMLRWRQDDYGRAMPLAEEALERRQQVLGQEDPETLKTQILLGQLYRRNMQTDQSADILRPALEACERVVGPEDPLTLTGYHQYSGALWDQGKREEALAMRRRNWEVRQRVLGREDWDTLSSMAVLAWALQESGQLKEAETLHRQSVSVTRRFLGPEHFDTLVSQRWLGDTLGRAGKYSEAEAFLRDGLEICRRTRPNSPLTHDYLAILGEVFCDMKRPIEGEVLLRECLEMRSNSPALGGNYWPTVAARSILGDCLAEQGKFAESEPMLLLGYKELSVWKNAPPHALTRAVDRLVCLYDKWDRPHDANMWRRKRQELVANATSDVPIGYGGKMAREVATTDRLDESVTGPLKENFTNHTLPNSAIAARVVDLGSATNEQIPCK